LSDDVRIPLEILEQSDAARFEVFPRRDPLVGPKIDARVFPAKNPALYTPANVPRAEFQEAALSIRMPTGDGTVRLLLPPSIFVLEDLGAEAAGPDSTDRLLAIWRADPGRIVGHSTLDALAVWLGQDDGYPSLWMPVGAQQTAFREWRVQSSGGLRVFLLHLAIRDGEAESFQTLATVQLEKTFYLRVIASGTREDDWDQAAYILSTLAYSRTVE
jgi:hypothetical protein